MKKPPVKRLKIRVYGLFSGTSLAFLFSAKEGKKLDKIHYDYDGVIWSDPKNEIRKELNYILTPAFLMLDSGDTVRLASWLLPTNQEENKEEFTKI